MTMKARLNAGCHICGGTIYHEPRTMPDGGWFCANCGFTCRILPNGGTIEYCNPKRRAPQSEAGTA